MSSLNPTLADGLWPWRRHLGDAAMVISTLMPQETVRAAQELARDLAQQDRAVVLTCVGASEPLFWHVPAGKELDTVTPDLVLLLVHKQFSASTKLLLATANSVVLITGSQPEDRIASLNVMQMIIQQASPDHIEVVVVADRRQTAREASVHLVRMANNRFGNRTSWRHLPARKIKEAVEDKEEGLMGSLRARPVPLSEAEVRAKEWEASFRRAEKLLEETQQTLQQLLEQVREPVESAQPSRETAD